MAQMKGILVGVIELALQLNRQLGSWPLQAPPGFLWGARWGPEMAKKPIANSIGLRIQLWARPFNVQHGHWGPHLLMRTHCSQHASSLGAFAPSLAAHFCPLSQLLPCSLPGQPYIGASLLASWSRSLGRTCRLSAQVARCQPHTSQKRTSRRP